MDFEDMSVEELEEKKEWYEKQGWESNKRAVKEELTNRDESDLSYEERLSEANLSDSEELRCDSVSLQND